MIYRKQEIMPAKGLNIFVGEIIDAPHKFIQKLEALGFTGNEESAEARITNLPRDKRHLRVKVLKPDTFSPGKVYFRAYKNKNSQGELFRWLLLSSEPLLSEIPESYETVTYETFLCRIGRWINACNEINNWYPE